MITALQLDLRANQESFRTQLQSTIRTQRHQQLRCANHGTHAKILCMPPSAQRATSLQLRRGKFSPSQIHQLLSGVLKKRRSSSRTRTHVRRRDRKLLPIQCLLLGVVRKGWLTPVDSRKKLPPAHPLKAFSLTSTNAKEGILPPDQGEQCLPQIHLSVILRLQAFSSHIFGEGNPHFTGRSAGLCWQGILSRTVMGHCP